MRHLILAALLSAAALPAFADETSGTVAAFDRLSKIIVLTDKTVWQFDDQTILPADMVSGDRVKVVFFSDGDNGKKRITAVERVSG